MHYHVVYDITQTDFPRWLLFAPVIVGVLGLGFIFIVWRMMSIYRFSFMNSVAPVIGAALVWCVTYVSVKSSYHHYLEVKSAMQKSQCEVVGGVVTGFQQIHRRKSTSRGETFTVKETDFEYYERVRPAVSIRPALSMTACTCAFIITPRMLLPIQGTSPAWRSLSNALFTVGVQA